jgi:ABC-type multidrug transport system fused ATPase/permease subunit
MIFFGYAITFRFGAFLVTLPPDHILFTPFQNMFVVLFAIIFGAFAIGQASAFTPDYTKARVACKRIFALLDRTPVIDNYSTDGQKPEVVEGSISINKVDFNYPSRPDVAVLQDFSLDVKPGQTIALVGPSGCGKSTIVSLTERFYDPLSHPLQLDGADLPDLNIHWLRQQIDLVLQ